MCKRSEDKIRTKRYLLLTCLLTVPAAVEVGFVVYFAGGVAMIFGARAIMHECVLT